jgi:PKD repeat protein
MKKVRGISAALWLILLLGFLANCCQVGSKVDTENDPLLMPSFIFSPITPLAGQTIQFSDTTSGGPTSWRWNFGDGSTSTSQNPKHVYEAEGQYQISLEVGRGSRPASVSNTLKVLPADTLMVSFTYSPSSPKPGQTVQFIDTSVAFPTAWQWDFGDGVVSPDQNPSHVFSEASSYRVTLTLSNRTGSNNASCTINVMPTITIIPGDRLIDWGNAGVWHDGIKGIPNYPVGIDLTGLTSYRGYTLDNSGRTDSRNAIQAALNDCPVLRAVLLGPGSYMIGPSGGLSIPSYKVLRGTEPFTIHPQTTLIYHHNTAAHFIDMDGSAASYTPEVSITSCAKDSNIITVDSVTGFAVGDQVIIDELNDPALVSIKDVDFPTTGCTYCSRENGTRSLNDVKLITAIDMGTRTITLHRPLYRTYTLSPQLVRDVAVGSRRINAGIESIRLITDGTAPSSTYFAISFYRSTFCWARKCELYNWYYKGCILQFEPLGCEVRECYFHDVPLGYSVAGNYAIGLSNHATDCLIEDNIVYHVHTSVALGSGGANGNVIAYNFMYNEHHYTQRNWFLGGTGHHGAHPYMNLWEGNYLRKMYADFIHGSSSHSVWLRNRATGMPVSALEAGEDPVQPTVNQEMSVINIPTFSYYWSLIGNVIGTPGFHTIYETYPITLATKCIWKVGFPDSSAQGGPTDPKVVATLLRHGNYDFVTSSTIWDSEISSHSLPSSLYLTAKPAFFGELAWPSFGPDLNPMESSIPAKYRFDHGIYFSGPITK